MKSCPSCDCNEITTTWVRHRFQYGIDPGVELTTMVPMRTCLLCSEEWLDYEAEGIIDKVIANHLSTVDVNTDEWETAAKAAIKRAKG